MPVTKDERFTLMGIRFNVWKAFQLVKTREPISVQPHASYTALIRIDPLHAKSTNLEEPVIVAQLPYEKGKSSPFLIDGAHRNYKALQEGKNLKAWYLTEKETIDIIVGNPHVKRKMKKYLKDETQTN